MADPRPRRGWRAHAVRRGPPAPSGKGEGKGRQHSISSVQVGGSGGSKLSSH